MVTLHRPQPGRASAIAAVLAPLSLTAQKVLQVHLPGVRVRENFGLAVHSKFTIHVNGGGRAARGDEQPRRFVEAPRVRGDLRQQQVVLRCPAPLCRLQPAHKRHRLDVPDADEGLQASAVRWSHREVCLSRGLQVEFLEGGLPEHPPVAVGDAEHGDLSV